MSLLEDGIFRKTALSTIPLFRQNSLVDAFNCRGGSWWLTELATVKEKVKLEKMQSSLLHRLRFLQLNAVDCSIVLQLHVAVQSTGE